MKPLLTKGQLRYNGQAPWSQMNSLCTKQPLNKGHPYKTAKMLFPKSGRYRGRGSTEQKQRLPIYNNSIKVLLLAVVGLYSHGITMHDDHLQ